MKLTYKYITRGIKNTLWPILHWYDITFKKELTVAVADLMLLRDGEMYNRQFYATSRLLDAKLYYEKGDDSFPYQIAVSYNYRPASYNREKRSKEFKDLLESVKKNGYDRNSQLIVDKELYLVNGTHRMALALYNNVSEITVEYWNRKNIVEKGFEQRPLSTLPPNILHDIYSEFKNIQNHLIQTGQTFIFWIACNDINKAKILFQQQEANFIFYKYYQILDLTLKFDDTYITNGFYTLCSPIKSEYKIQNDNYFSNFIFKIKETLSYQYKSSQSFYISPNCLKGHQLFKLLKPNSKEFYF
ncbi:MAG: hypothetical protein MJ198_04970 [Bacteroidales bacterium]|nr:hypothetical protein [Bacteroidales bacterium]